MQTVATARAGMVIDIDDHLDTRQMDGQRTAVRSALRSVGLALGGSRLVLLFLAGGLDLLGFFQSQQKLVFGQRLSPSAEAVALQFLDDLNQAGILDVTRQNHRLQRVRIVGKLSAVIAMTGSDHIRRRRATMESGLIHLVAGHPA